MTRTIGVISGKGGVGKTTVAINMAAALSRQFNKMTTIVDCNLTTSHVGLYVGNYHYPKTLNDVLRGEATIEEAMYVLDGGMSVVPASLSLQDLDGIDILHLKENIRELEKMSEFVLLDTAPGFGREAIGAMRACDEALFVANPNILSVTDVIRCNEVCEELEISPIGIVLNMVNRDKYEISPVDIERTTGIPVLAVIPYHHNLIRSLAMKAPLVSVKPKDKISEEIIRLSSFIAGASYDQPGFFSRFFRSFRR